MSAIVHVILYYRKQIWQQARSAHTDADDVHRRLMRVYKEVPLWWYAVLFLINFALGLAAIRAWPTQLPVWAYIVSILMGAFFMLPCGE
jgi:undecaprenyl pyrophosphate phosphatase UppP